MKLRAFGRLGRVSTLTLGGGEIDGVRGRLPVLTGKGQACTRAADEAAARTPAPPAATLTPAERTAPRRALAHPAAPGRIRPIW
jgi:hypothetical protein